MQIAISTEIRLGLVADADRDTSLHISMTCSMTELREPRAGRAARRELREMYRDFFSGSELYGDSFFICRQLRCLDYHNLEACLDLKSPHN